MAKRAGDHLHWNELSTLFRNRGLSQQISSNGTNGDVSNPGQVVITSVNTAVNQNITLTGQLTNATDFMI